MAFVDNKKRAKEEKDTHRQSKKKNLKYTTKT